jgi:hypothetical protein
MPQSARQRRAIEGPGAAIVPDTWGLDLSDAILAALFLNFAGAASLHTMLSGQRGRSTIANKLFRLAMIGGIIALSLKFANGAAHAATRLRNTAAERSPKSSADASRKAERVEVDKSERSVRRSHRVIAVNPTN